MGVDVRSSARTSTSTCNPRPTPTHPHSTQKSRFSCPQAGCACGQAEYRWARGTWARWEVDVVACARCVRPQCVAWPVRSSRPQASSNVGCEHKKAPGRSARGFRCSGADDGNRTRVICLEGRGSTIELHPRTPEGDTKIVAGIVHVRDIYTPLPYDGAPDISPTGCSAAW